MKTPEQGFNPEKEKNNPNINLALFAAYESLYFNDNNDYESALW